MIIDFHTHAFPDALANEVVASLARFGKIKPHTTGTHQSLLTSMNRAGIDISVVCTIATKPSQFSQIFHWLLQIQSQRIIALPSIHPNDINWHNHLQMIDRAGFPGLKMHPFYQDFTVDDGLLFPLYQSMSDMGLFLMLHCGHDLAHPPSKRASPEKIFNIIKAFPKLKVIATHLGGWKMWEEVEETLLGKSVYLDTAFSLNSMKMEQAKTLILNHSPELLLFGSDSPWEDQKDALTQIQELKLAKHIERAILGESAQKLLQGFLKFS